MKACRTPESTSTATTHQDMKTLLIRMIGASLLSLFISTSHAELFIESWASSHIDLPQAFEKESPSKVCGDILALNTSKKIRCSIVMFKDSVAVVIEDSTENNAKGAQSSEPQPQYCSSGLFKEFYQIYKDFPVRLLENPDARTSLEAPLIALAQQRSSEFTALLFQDKCPLDRHAAAVLLKYSSSCRQLFNEFLPLLTDKAFEVRNGVSQCVSRFMSLRDGPSRFKAVDAAFLQFKMGTAPDRDKSLFIVEQAMSGHPEIAEYVKKNHLSTVAKAYEKTRLPNLSEVSRSILISINDLNSAKSR